MLLFFSSRAPPAFFCITTLVVVEVVDTLLDELVETDRTCWFLVMNDVTALVLPGPRPRSFCDSSLSSWITARTDSCRCSKLYCSCLG